MDPEIRSHIADELNVIQMEDIATAGDDLVSISIKANGGLTDAEIEAMVKAAAENEGQALLITKTKAAEAENADALKAARTKLTTLAKQCTDIDRLNAAYEILDGVDFEISDETYDEYGVNTKSSFNTPPKA